MAAETPAGGVAAALPSKEEIEREEAEYLRKLADHFKANGVVFEAGWRVQVRYRSGGSSAGHRDRYWIEPSGKTFRSLKQVSDAYGIETKSGQARSGTRGSGGAAAAAVQEDLSTLPDEASLDREAAASRARAARDGLALPHVQACGVRVVTLGGSGFVVRRLNDAIGRPGAAAAPDSSGSPASVPELHGQQLLLPRGLRSEHDPGRRVRIACRVDVRGRCVVEAAVLGTESGRGGDDDAPSATDGKPAPTDTPTTPRAVPSAGAEGQSPAWTPWPATEGRSPGPTPAAEGRSPAPATTPAGPAPASGGPTFVELGSGDTPAEAWRGAARRVEAGDGAAKDPSAPEVPAELLASLRSSGAFSDPLAGLEAFGLAELATLRAAEGLPGAKYADDYPFVEQGAGWRAFAVRLHAELTEGGRPRWVAGAGRAARGGGGGGGAHGRERAVEELAARLARRALRLATREADKAERAEARERERAARREEAEGRRRLREEAKEGTRAAREEGLARAADAARRDAAERDKLRDDSALLLEGGAAPPPALPSLAGDEARLGPGAASTLAELWIFLDRFRGLLGLEGEQLPTCGEIEAGLLAGWDEAGGDGARDGDGPAISPAPGEEGAPNPSPTDAFSTVVLALVSAPLREAYQQALEASPGARDADCKAVPRAPHPIPLTADAATEAVRRLAALHAAAAARESFFADSEEGERRRERRRGGGGPGTDPSAPVSDLEGSLDPSDVLLALTAGPPASVALWPEAVAVPDDADECARPARRAARDAEARFHSAALLWARRGGPVTPERTPAEAEALRRRWRPVLRLVLDAACEAEGAQELRSVGDEATAAAAGGRTPHGHALLDLRSVGARVDAGEYALAEDPVTSLTADLEACATSLQLAARSRAPAAAALQERGVPEACARARDAWEAAAARYRTLGPERFVVLEAKRGGGGSDLEVEPGEEVEPGASDAGAGGGAEPARRDRPPGPGGAAVAAAAAPSTASRGESSRSLVLWRSRLVESDRPYHPRGEGCQRCWGKDDAARTLICDGCSAEYHIYCLPKPLPDIPNNETWLCPACLAEGLGGRGDELTGNATLGPGAASEGEREGFGAAPASAASADAAAWPRIAELAATRDIRAWTPRQKLDLLATLTSSLSGSPLLRRHLDASSDAVKAAFRDKAECERALRELQREMGLGGGSGDGVGGAAQGHRSTRSRVDPTREAEKVLRELSRCEETIARAPQARLEPLGADRLGRRYWEILRGAVEPGASRSDAPVVAVESETSFDVASTSENLRRLEAWLDRRGRREHALRARLKGLAQRLQVWEDARSAKLAADAVDAAPDVADGLEETQRDGDPADGAPKSEAGPGPDRMDVDSVDTVKAGLGGDGSAEARSSGDGSTSGEARPAADEAPAVPLVDPSPLAHARRALAELAMTRNVQAASGESNEEVAGLAREAESAAAITAVLLRLESTTDGGWLKQHWKTWGAVAPDVTSVSTLSAFWVRLEAFRLALRSRAPARQPLWGSLPDLGLGTGRYPARERRPRPSYRTLLGGGEDDSDSDAGPPPVARAADAKAEPPHEDRAARMAKRARMRGADWDEPDQLPDGTADPSSEGGAGDSDDGGARAPSAEANAGPSSGAGWEGSDYAPSEGPSGAESDELPSSEVSEARGA